jgi:hypothetical protein
VRGNRQSDGSPRAAAIGARRANVEIDRGRHVPQFLETLFGFLFLSGFPEHKDQPGQRLRLIGFRIDCTPRRLERLVAIAGEKFETRQVQRIDSPCPFQQGQSGFVIPIGDRQMPFQFVDRQFERFDERIGLLVFRFSTDRQGHRFRARFCR